MPLITIISTDRGKVAVYWKYMYTLTVTCYFVHSLLYYSFIQYLLHVHLILALTLWQWINWLRFCLHSFSVDIWIQYPRHADKAQLICTSILNLLILQADFASGELCNRIQTGQITFLFKCTPHEEVWGHYKLHVQLNDLKHNSVV